MVVFSKLFYPLSTVACHELAHPWSSSCVEAAAGIFRSSFLESVKIYSLLYLAGGVLRKAGVKYFKYQYLLDVLRSSCFLSVNGGGFVASLCILRKLLGYFNYISVVFIPVLIASFVAILIEKKSRRSTLILYMANLAVESSYNMLKSRGIVHPLPNGEILLFCAAAASMMYLYRKKDGISDGVLSSLVRFFIGPNESRTSYKLVGGSGEEHLSKTPEHQVQYVKWIRPTFKAFATGYLVQLAPLLLGELSLLLKTKKPGRLLRPFFNKDCVRCGLFLGSFVATFKLVEFAMAILRKKEDELNALVAGGLSGLSMVFYRSSTIALYLASKIAEVLYNRGISEGVLPAIPYAGILCYSFSTALVLHASTWEVQSVRPSYWRYLNVVTAKRFCEINRQKTDEIFGTDSARLFPKDDLYATLRRR